MLLLDSLLVRLAMETKGDEDPGVGLDRDPGVIAHERDVGRAAADDDRRRGAGRRLTTDPEGLGPDHHATRPFRRARGVDRCRDERPVA